MQLKHFFIQDYNGTALPGATCTLYLAGTTSLATGLQDASGAAIGNPMTADDNGLLQFAAPDGQYDLTCESGLRVYTLQVQFLDAIEQIQYIEEQKAVVQQYANLVVAEYKPPVQPTLVCDFVNNDYRVLGQYGLESKTLPEQVTFTRASTATRFNALGVIEEVAVDTPRIDYDPVTGECKGLLIEEQRTNLLIHTKDFTGWSASDLIINQNATIAPDGSLSAVKVVAGTTTTNHFLYKTTQVLNDATYYTFSCYAKKAEQKYAVVQLNSGAYAATTRVYVDLDAGDVTSSSGLNLKIDVMPCVDGWWRISITAPTTSANTTIAYIVGTDSSTSYYYTGDGVSGTYFWGAQFEEGAFTTSYIPTTTAQVTRAADVCPISPVSSWLGNSEGTVYADISRLGDFDGYDAGWYLSSDASNLIGFLFNNQSNSVYIVVKKDGVNQAILYRSVGGSAGFKSAFSYKENEFLFSSGGVTVEDSNGLLPVIDSMVIGCNNIGAGQLNGHIKAIRYYPKALPAAELQELTA